MTGTRGRRRADGPKDVLDAEIGQGEIEDDRRDVASRLDEVARLAPVPRRDHGHTLALQGEGRHLAHERLVVHHEHHGTVSTVPRLGRPGSTRLSDGNRRRRADWKEHAHGRAAAEL